MSFCYRGSIHRTRKEPGRINPPLPQQAGLPSWKRGTPVLQFYIDHWGRIAIPQYLPIKIDSRWSLSPIFIFYNKVYVKNKGRRVIERIFTSLIRIWSDGPATSFRASPTVSPKTAAECAGDPLPPYCPSSINFFALSHAPPELNINTARSAPTIFTPIRKAASGQTPSVNPIIIAMSLT